MATAQKSYDIADIGLADDGQRRIEWADRQMPVLRSIRERFEKEKPLDGIRMACCLPVTTETANLVRTLMAGGADVALCASNPLSTQDETAAALVDRYGAEVHAINGEDNDTYYRHINTAVDKHPNITMDDGADVISVLHGERPEQLSEVYGGTEETTTGVIRLKALEAEGKLGFPIIAGNKGDLDSLTNSTYEARPLVEGHQLNDGREIFLLAEGRLVNLASAEGHPAAVMDMSFANQALAAEYVAKNHESLETKVHTVPREIDHEIARLKLASKGIQIDQLSEAQSKYLASWDQGT